MTRECRDPRANGEHDLARELAVKSWIPDIAGMSGRWPYPTSVE
jgi:hypothetical protein